MHIPTRRGYSLLEVIAVLAVIGILAASAVVRLAPESISNFGAKTDARRLAVDLLQARRRAIATGDNHLLSLTYNGGSIVGYTVQKRLADSSTVDVDTLRRFPDGVFTYSRHFRLGACIGDRWSAAANDRRQE